MKRSVWYERREWHPEQVALLPCVPSSVGDRLLPSNSFIVEQLHRRATPSQSNSIAEQLHAVLARSSSSDTAELYCSYSTALTRLSSQSSIVPVNRCAYPALCSSTLYTCTPIDEPGPCKTSHRTTPMPATAVRRAAMTMLACRLCKCQKYELLHDGARVYGPYEDEP